MHPRLYRLFETRQRIDRALADEQVRRQPNPLRLMTLKSLEARVKELIHRLSRQPVYG